MALPPQTPMPPFVAALVRDFNLTPEETAYLQRAGIRSLEMLYSLLLATPGLDDTIIRRKMILALVVDRLSQSFKDFFDKYQSAPVPRFSGAAAPSPVALDAIGQVPIIAKPEPPVPAEFNLASEPHIPPIDAPAWRTRDQVVRNSCIAFAAADCVAAACAGQDGAMPIDLSPQYLYWHMRKRPPAVKPPGWENGGTKLGQARDVLRDLGICAETLCAYLGVIPAGQDPDGPMPSAAAEQDAASRRMPEDRIIYHDWPDPAHRPPNVAQILYRCLRDSGSPVAIALPVFQPLDRRLDNWTLASAAHSGIIPPPPGLWTAVGLGHSVCVVGFDPDPNDPAGGWFIFRNSKGPEWAVYAPDPLEAPPLVPAPGYGAIAASYVDKYCWEILGVRKALA